MRIPFKLFRDLLRIVQKIHGSFHEHLHNRFHVKIKIVRLNFAIADVA